MEADTALTGRWHLHQGWERDLEMPPPSSKGLSQCGEVFNISSTGGVLSTPNGTNLRDQRSTLSGGRYCTDRAVAPAPGVGEGSRDAPSPHPRGSVSAGKYSVSVVSEGSSVYTPNGTNLISGVHSLARERLALIVAHACNSPFTHRSSRLLLDCSRSPASCVLHAQAGERLAIIALSSRCSSLLML